MISFKNNKKLTVINLFAGPCSGKSVLALFLAAHMQVRGEKTEYVNEFAKTQVWDNRMNQSGGIFTEQDYIGAHQHNMIRRLVEHDIDYAVTDTSLLLGIIYMPEWYPPTYKPFLLEVFNSYTNINVFVERGNLPYVRTGRNQTLSEAQQKDAEIKQLLIDNNIPFFTVTQDIQLEVDELAIEILAYIFPDY